MIYNKITQLAKKLAAPRCSNLLSIIYLIIIVIIVAWLSYNAANVIL